MNESTHTWATPHGNPVVIITRDDTADAALVDGLLNGDEYRLKQLGQLGGVALDIGAHVGTISLALLADHPGLSVVAVEPIPENVALIRQSGASWERLGRLTVLTAAASDTTDPVRISFDYTHHDGTEASYVHQNRFVGGIWRAGYEGRHVTVPGVTLRGLAHDYAPDGFSLVKIDAEGAEYPFLEDGAELAQVIVGEWHDGDSTRIRQLLEPTHDFQVLDDHGGTGIFRAFRR